MNRRQFLGLTSCLVSTTAGCLGSSTPTSTTTPSSTASSSCRDDLDRLTVGWKVREGPLDGFALDLSTDAVPRGGQLTVTLRNVTAGERTTGIKRKYDIERQTDSGWQSIFWKPKNAYWTDEAIAHSPGEGFTWSFTVTQRGFRAVEGQPAYYVCAPLEPGTYRFVYWGITPEAEHQSDAEMDYALGSTFTITQS